MPFFNFNTVLKRLNGEFISRQFAGMQILGDQKVEADVTKWKKDPVAIADMVVHFVLEVIEIESRDPRTGQAVPKKQSDKEKYERFQLAEKIYSRGDDGLAEITETERQMIKKCTDVAANAEMMGLVWRWLEAPEAEPVKTEEAAE